MAPAAPGSLTASPSARISVGVARASASRYTRGNVEEDSSAALSATVFDASAISSTSTPYERAMSAVASRQPLAATMTSMSDPESGARTSESSVAPIVPASL